MACPACGFDAAAEFAFCPKCGHRLAVPAAATEPDRRPVTVMFADLSGFTALSEALDPEIVRSVQTELFTEMSSTIQRLEGFVEKYLGDSVMAVFGAPVAHDEDPERAVRAAIMLHEQAAALSARWLPRIGRPLALHVGINTGPVVAGHIGSDPAATYAVTGDTVNTAARLQGAAGPGETVVSRSTWLLTQHAFGFEPLGELPLKGKAQPVAAYRVVDARPVPEAARGLQAHGLATPFVGRGADLERLLGAFESMRAGQAQLVSIVAEAGTGKSRLLAEFLERLGARDWLAGVAVRRAACSSLGERAYGVPAALLRDAYGLSGQEPVAEAKRKIVAALADLGVNEQQGRLVSQYLGDVIGLAPDHSHTRYLDPEQLRSQIFSALHAVVDRRLQLGPVMLIVEDLHWADAASLDVLGYLLEQFHGRPFMLLATHRPSPGVDALARGTAGHTAIALEPLSPQFSGALLDGLFGSSRRTLPDELRMQIVEHAGGNPLFLEEMVRALIAEGLLQRHDGAWVYRPRTPAVQVPSTIHGLLLGRIDRLPPQVRQTLREAAVIGPLFAEALLQDIATARAGSLGEALATLVEQGLLLVAQPPAGTTSAQPGRQFRFRHGLFQEVAYLGLLMSRRTELHTRIGEALERRCGGAPRQLEELQALAHHFRLGTDRQRAAHYLVAAGDWARDIYANADAIRHYAFALEALAGGAGLEDQMLAVRERLADVLAPAGRIAEATQQLEAVRDGHATWGDRVAQARVLRKIAALRWEAGQREAARQCLSAGLELLDPTQPHVELAWLYQQMGELAFRSGDNLAALEWTQRALEHVERLAPSGQPAASGAAVALALNIQGVALARQDRLEEAVARLEQSVAVARRADLPQAECRALANLGVLYSSGDPQRAIDACERGLQTAHRIGHLGLQSRLSANLAVAYCTLTNRCDERGVAAAHEAIRIDRSTGQLDHLAVSLVVLAQIHQCHGEPARALRHYQEALALAEKSAEPQLLFPCYDGLATLYLDLDDGERAGHYMALARDTCDRAGLEPDALIVLPFLA